jgi:TetR/AcrR family transcriptional regulator, regulator of biofilm formation and stress response
MSAAASQRRPRADGDHNRRAILDAALRILRDLGISSLTLRAVATEAHTSLALTTYHFATKENLIAEALALAARETTGALRAAAAELAGTPGLAAPAAIADRLSALMMSRLGDRELAVASVYELALAAARRPALADAMAAWNAAYAEVVQTMLGACGVDRPREAAAIVAATMEGLALLQLTDPDPNFDREVLRPAMRRLLSALAPGS